MSLKDRMSKIARTLVADDVFTVKKPIRFKPSYGTMNCLVNARMIAEAGYKFVKATYKYDTNMADWKMTAFFERDGEVASHEFNGFSFGYGGEGPRGMMEFSQIFGIGLNERKVTEHGAAGLPSAATVDLEQAFG